MDKGRLEGKIAFITGASSGIGEAIARRFLSEGACVVGCGRREKAALKHERFFFVSADVSSFEAAKKAVEAAVSKFGALDIVINSAGLTVEGGLENTGSDDFNNLFQVNVGGVFNVCKAAAPFLRARKGSSIINIASDLGIKPIRERIAYCPSKAAVIMLTRCIALELSPDVRANCILPGLVETPMIQHRFENAVDPEALRATMMNLYPMKRIGKVEDMSAAALYLASDESSFMTGAELPICGGRLI